MPAGTARALLAMFLVSEVHPFADGNGRLARLVMNAELSVVGACRIIIPTLFREEYLDCLRVFSRSGDPVPFIAAMQKIQGWTAAFDYQSLDGVIEKLKACNAFERSRAQLQLLAPRPAADCIRFCVKKWMEYVVVGSRACFDQAGKIDNDDLSDKELKALLVAAFQTAFNALKPGGAIYVAHSDTEGLARRCLG